MQKAMNFLTSQLSRSLSNLLLNSNILDILKPSTLYWKINRKIKSINLKLFKSFTADILLTMTDSLTLTLRSKILRLLLLHWILLVIVEEIHCHRNIVYTMQENLFMYDSFFKSQFRSKSALWKIFSAAEDFLITYLKQQSWIMQKEMMWFLWKEWSIHVYQFTILRILKKRHWSNKKKQHVSIRQICCSWRLNSLSSSMRLCSTRLQDDVIKSMHQLMSQLVIKSLERESISEAFFQCIQSMTIYFVSIFMKTDSTTRLSSLLWNYQWFVSWNDKDNWLWQQRL